MRLADRFELRLALRYLWAARRQAHTAFLSLISIVGVAVGVATLLISLALLSGLQGQIKERLLRSGPQLVVEPVAGSSIPGSADIVRALASYAAPKDIEQLISGIAWAATTDGGKGRPVRLRSYLPGHEPAAEQTFGRTWRIELREGQTPVLVTRNFAAELGLRLGEEVRIVAPRLRLTPFGPVPVSRKFVIARLVASGTEERSPDAFLSYDDISPLFGTAGAPTTIEAHTTAEAADAAQAALASRWKEASVRTWKDTNRPLFLALRLEKIVMFATISLIVLVAALNLVSSLSMLIVEKRRQVGILRTIGATEASILGVFLGVGLLIGLGGTALGNVLGLGISWAANHWGLVPLPGDVYYLDHIPFEIDAPDVIGVNVIAVLLSIAATYYPARLASRLDPIEAIRDE